ncbi:MAG: pyridoxamine 5'-phosphate oxidase family protein [Lacisediminihabitans sp.]
MSFPANPWELLREWLPANDDPDRPQITLSTVTPAGEAGARTVLLSEYDEHGFYFHTDALSRKVEHITVNPAVALTFLWPNFTQQLVVQGRASVAPAEEIAAAFRGRSPYLQQLAWQNSREFAQLPLEERRVRWAAFLDEHESGFDQPDGWIGFLVQPTRLTFWGSNPDAASRRAEYAATPHGWELSYLPG